MVVRGRGAFSDERGTPVFIMGPRCLESVLQRSRRTFVRVFGVELFEKYFRGARDVLY